MAFHRNDMKGASKVPQDLVNEGMNVGSNDEPRGRPRKGRRGCWWGLGAVGPGDLSGPPVAGSNSGEHADKTWRCRDILSKATIASALATPAMTSFSLHGRKERWLRRNDPALLTESIGVCDLSVEVFLGRVMLALLGYITWVH